MKANSREARYEQFYKTHFHKICAYCRSYIQDPETAYDLAQDSFVSFWYYTKEWESFEDELPLLFKIARNKCLNVLRNRKHRDAYISDMTRESLGAIQDDAANRLLSWEVFRIVRQVFMRMPEDFGKTFLMSKKQGLRQDEIADRLHVSKKTVQYRLKRTRDALWDALKDYL